MQDHYSWRTVFLHFVPLATLIGYLGGCVLNHPKPDSTIHVGEPHFRTYIVTIQGVGWSGQFQITGGIRARSLEKWWEHFTQNRTNIILLGAWEMQGNIVGDDGKGEFWSSLDKALLEVK